MRNKLITFLTFISLLQLVSCMQAESVSRNKCLTSNNVSMDCSKLSSPSSSTTFRKKYIAEINIATSYEDDVLTLLEDGNEKDSDQDYKCELYADAGKAFKVLIKNDQLMLRDGESQILLSRQDGFFEDDLLGSWIMTEETSQAQIVTELVLYNYENLKIRKTCNLR